jgi:hypothetical protein
MTAMGGLLKARTVKDAEMNALRVATLAALACAALTAPAQDLAESRYYYFQTSVATTHFDPKPYHNNDTALINLERRSGTGFIVGGAFFQNSFGQPSEYLYVGKLYWVPRTSETVYAKVTGGLIYGYKDEYQDQIPLNKYGVAPAILPAIGFQARTLGGELVVFGTAGAMVTLGFKF